MKSLQTKSVRPRPLRKPAVKSYHHGSLKEALVDEGLRLLESEGLAALSLRRIAQQLDVSQTAPLHHFKGKSEYLAVLAARGFEILMQQRRLRLEGIGEPAQRLLVMMTVYVEFALGHPGLFHLMYGPSIPDKAGFVDLEQIATRSYQQFEETVDAYLDALGASPDGREGAALAAWTASYGYAALVLDQENGPWGIMKKIRRQPIRIAGEVFQIFINGLRPASP